MYSVRPLPQFLDWLDRLPDNVTRGLVVARIKRLERGLISDVRSIGGGVSELRIHQGPGWRIYFTRRERMIIVLLAGGSKRTQEADIRQARKLAKSVD